MYEVIVDCTNKCYMNCKLCGTASQKDGTNHLSASTIVEIIKTVKEIDARVFLGGGCFFCHPEWKNILKISKEIGADVYIDMPLTEPVLQAIKEYPPGYYSYKPSVSLWGIGATHDELAGSDSFFLLEEYKQIMKSGYGVSFVMTKQLLAQREQVIAVLNSLEHCNRVYFHRLMPTGRCSAEYLPEMHELREFMDSVNENVKKLDGIRFHHTLLNTPCKAYGGRVFVDWHGNIYGCGWVDDETETIGNILELDLKNVIQNATSGKYSSYKKCPLV